MQNLCLRKKHNYGVIQVFTIKTLKLNFIIFPIKTDSISIKSFNDNSLLPNTKNFQCSKNPSETDL